MDIVSFRAIMDSGTDFRFLASLTRRELVDAVTERWQYTLSLVGKRDDGGLDDVWEPVVTLAVEPDASTLRLHAPTLQTPDLGLQGPRRGCRGK